MSSQSLIVVDAVMVLGDGAEILSKRWMAQRNLFPEPKGKVISRFRGNKVEASPVEYPIWWLWVIDGLENRNNGVCFLWGYSIVRESLVAFIPSTRWLLWYLCSKSGVWRWWLGSYVLLLSGYPFHLTKYWRALDLPWCQWAHIDLTLYCSLSLIRSGGGRLKLGPYEIVSW